MAVQGKVARAAARDVAVAAAARVGCRRMVRRRPHMDAVSENTLSQNILLLQVVARDGVGGPSLTAPVMN